MTDKSTPEGVYLIYQDPKTGTAASINLTTWQRVELNNVNGMSFKHRPSQ